MAEGMVVGEEFDDIISSEPTLLDAESAQQFLDMFPYARQRPLKEDRVAYYAEQMANGTFLSASTLTVVHAPDEHGLVRGFLVNGQHRLHALIKAQTQMIFIVHHFRADSVEEVNARYAVEDINALRSGRDQDIALDLPTAHRMSTQEMGQLQSAATFVRTNFNVVRARGVSMADRIANAEMYGGPMRVFGNYVSGGFASLVRQLRKRAVLAVALTTIREARQVYGGEKIEEFWRGIALDSGLETRDPRKTVVRHLQALEASGRVQKDKSSPAYTARYVAACFNAWVEDRSLLSPRVDVRAPMLIRGTRWSKK